METTISQIVPIAIAVIAAVPGMLAFIAQMRKEKTEAERDRSAAQQAAQAAALEIINPLREELARLRTRVGELETLLETKEARIEELEHCIDEQEIRNSALTRSVHDLEGQNADLRKRLDIVERGRPRKRPTTGDTQ